MENTIHEERLADVGLFSKDKERPGDNVIMLFSVMQDSHIEHGDPLVSLSTEETGLNEHGNLQKEIRLQRKHWNAWSIVGKMTSVAFSAGPALGSQAILSDFVMLKMFSIHANENP